MARRYYSDEARAAALADEPPAGRAYIYALVDPRDGAPRYVGKTAVGLSARLVAHVGEARQGRRSHKCNWIRALRAAGISPGIVVLETVEAGSDPYERERWWIERRQAEDGRLTNVRGVRVPYSVGDRTPMLGAGAVDALYGIKPHWRGLPVATEILSLARQSVREWRATFGATESYLAPEEMRALYMAFLFKAYERPVRRAAAEALLDGRLGRFWMDFHGLAA